MAKIKSTVDKNIDDSIVVANPAVADAPLSTELSARKLKLLKSTRDSRGNIRNKELELLDRLNKKGFMESVYLKAVDVIIESGAATLSLRAKEILAESFAKATAEVARGDAAGIFQSRLPTDQPAQTPLRFPSEIPETESAEGQSEPTAAPTIPKTWEEAKAQVPGLTRWSVAKAAKPDLTIIDHMRDTTHGYGRWTLTEPGLPRSRLRAWHDNSAYEAIRKIQLPPDLHVPKREYEKGSEEKEPEEIDLDELRAAYRLIKRAEKARQR